jgi:hypothetical protein
MSPASTHITDQAGTRSKHKTLSVLPGCPTATPTSVRIQRQNWPYRAPGRAEPVIHTQRRLDNMAYPEDGYQRSHVPLTSLLITNGDADLCKRMHGRNSLTSA